MYVCICLAVWFSITLLRRRGTDQGVAALFQRRGTSVRNVEVVKEALASRQGQQRCPRQRSANERHDDEDDDHRGSGVTTQAGEGRGEKNHRPRSNRWMGMGMSMGMGSVDPGALASGLAAAMETTNAQFVFKGTIRGATAFLAIVSLFLASCQIISLLQEEHAWLVRESETKEVAGRELSLGWCRGCCAVLFLSFSGEV